MKSQVSYVAVNRAEGPCEETGAVVFHSGDTTPTDYDDGHHHYRGAKVVKVAPGEIAWAVLHQFFLWGQTAPENGGYDKCWDQHCRMMDEEGCRVSAKKMMDECEMG